MGRQAKRVPLDFGWPLKEVWPGYLLPDWLREATCQSCDGSGYSRRGRELRDLWWGHAPFRPEDNGSTPFGPDHPPIRAMAERNISAAPEFYGRGDGAVAAEARRLADRLDGAWQHHLNDDDVAALRSNERPYWAPAGATTREVNEATLEGLTLASSAALVCIRARCEREGKPFVCDACDGDGTVERWGGQRAAADQWDSIDPPTGDGWQMWETTSEGSPMSPVFATREALADWLVGSGTSYFGDRHASRDEWLAVIGGEPAMVQLAPNVRIM